MGRLKCHIGLFTVFHFMKMPFQTHARLKDVLSIIQPEGIFINHQLKHLKGHLFNINAEIYMFTV